MTLENFSSPLVIVILASGAGLILLGLVLIFVVRQGVQERITRFVGSAEEEQVAESPEEKRRRLEQVREDANNMLAVFSSDKLRLQLASAHWQISDREFVFLRLVATIGAFWLGWALVHNIIGGLGLGLLAYLLPGFFLFRATEQRRKRFADQLLDALILIRGAVSSGYSLLQALDLAKDEMNAPASEEFGRVVREVQLGLPLSQALLNLSGRMENDDLHMVVVAIIINSQVGGNLTTMLNAVTNTIRARIFLFGEVRALTSYARYAGYFLTLLPFITALAIYLVNPGYFDVVPESTISQIILAVAMLLLLLGNIIIRRIIRIRI